MRRAFVLTGLLLLTAAFQVEWDPKVGDTVLAWWEPNAIYFVGTIVEEEGSRELIVFEDGEQAWVNSSQIRPLDVNRGTEVMARWSDGSYYPGRVSRIVGRALFIEYDDGDSGWTSWAGIARR
jgi:hypothetical protein